MLLTHEWSGGHDAGAGNIQELATAAVHLGRRRRADVGQHDLRGRRLCASSPPPYYSVSKAFVSIGKSPARGAGTARSTRGLEVLFDGRNAGHKVLKLVFERTCDRLTAAGALHIGLSNKHQ